VVAKPLTPAEVKELIDDMAAAQLEKMNRRLYKGTWRNDNTWYLLGRVIQEVIELTQAISGGSPEEAAEEAVDVANVAAMVRDVVLYGNVGKIVDGKVFVDKNKTPCNFPLRVTDGATDGRAQGEIKTSNDGLDVSNAKTLGGAENGLKIDAASAYNADERAAILWRLMDYKYSPEFAEASPRLKKILDGLEEALKE
jgi:NTP pyrophosphatase (non-canonical NTP hydrolase)